MARGKENPKVDWYFSKDKKWQLEIKEMRSTALGLGLTEELKWGCPCYSLENRNIVLIHVFKEYCAYLFFKGALMKDPKKILIQQTKNVQAARQIRFTNLEEIEDMKTDLKNYIKEAIKVEKSGAKVPMKKTAEFKMPEELQFKLDKDSKLKKAFNSLTPGRQRGYILFFLQQSNPKPNRIE